MPDPNKPSPFTSFPIKPPMDPAREFPLPSRDDHVATPTPGGPGSTDPRSRVPSPIPGKPPGSV